MTLIIRTDPQSTVSDLASPSSAWYNPSCVSERRLPPITVRLMARTVQSVGLVLDQPLFFAPRHSWERLNQFLSIYDLLSTGWTGVARQSRTGGERHSAHMSAGPDVVQKRGKYRDKARVAVRQHEDLRGDMKTTGWTCRRNVGAELGLVCLAKVAVGSARQCWFRDWCETGVIPSWG